MAITTLMEFEAKYRDVLPELAKLARSLAAVESWKDYTPEQFADLIEDFIREQFSFSVYEDWKAACSKLRDSVRIAGTDGK